MLDFFSWSAYVVIQGLSKGLCHLYDNLMTIAVRRRRYAMTKTIHKTLPLALLALFAPLANAEITQDCILEGVVDMRRAEQLGQSVYVKFRNARSGGEAACDMSRRSKSRRINLISTPNIEELQNVDLEQGDRVRYRYIERDHQHGYWELVDIES
jgi:hypothetical protein